MLSSQFRGFSSLTGHLFASSVLADPSKGCLCVHVILSPSVTELSELGMALINFLL